jgi:hypothetical protein
MSFEDINRAERNAGRRVRSETEMLNEESKLKMSKIEELKQCLAVHGVEKQNIQGIILKDGPGILVTNWHHVVLIENNHGNITTTIFNRRTWGVGRNIPQIAECVARFANTEEAIPPLEIF